MSERGTRAGVADLSVACKAEDIVGCSGSPAVRVRAGVLRRGLLEHGLRGTSTQVPNDGIDALQRDVAAAERAP